MPTTYEVFKSICAKIKCGNTRCKACTDFFESGDKCPYEDVSWEEMDGLLSRIYEQVSCKYDLTEEELLSMFCGEIKEKPRG